MNRRCEYTYIDNNGTRTRCPHDIGKHPKYCIFHDPFVTEKAARFYHALDELIYRLHNDDLTTIDLRGFKFPKLIYKGKIFKKAVDLRKAEFLDLLNFDHVQFESEVDFHKATFHGMSNFQSAIFKGKAKFIGAHFKQKVIFVGGEFQNRAIFHGCKFSENAAFVSRRFCGPTVFQYVTFYKDADFFDCKFDQSVDFGKTLFKQRSNFTNAVFNGEIKLEKANINLLKGLKGVGLNFNGAVLETANFWEHPVLEKCSFRNSFLISCNLAGKTLIDCDFTGAVLKSVFTNGWKLDEKTKEKTKYIFTDYKVVENITHDGGHDRKYVAVKESRVPVKGNFGDDNNKNFSLLDFALEPYKWEFLLDFPEEIQTGVINYINFFRDYARVATGIDIGIATNPVGKKIRLSFIIENEESEEKVKGLLRQYISNIFRPFSQLQIDFSNSQAPDHDKQLLLINYQNELLSTQARLIYALQDLSVRRKTAEGISILAAERAENKTEWLPLIDKLIDKIGVAQPIAIAHATATNTSSIDVTVENKSEIRLSLAELYDEITTAIKQSNDKSKLSEALSEEIQSANNDLAKGENVSSLRQRLKNIISRSVQFAKNAIDYGIKNGDKIIKLCEKLGEMIGN